MPKPKKPIRCPVCGKLPDSFVLFERGHCSYCGLDTEEAMELAGLGKRLATAINNSRAVTRDPSPGLQPILRRAFKLLSRVDYFKARPDEAKN